MKTILTSILATVAAGAAFGGDVIAYDTVSPSSGSSDMNAALILLLMVGLVVATGGFRGTDRAKTQDTDASDDDDVIMKF